MLVIDAATKASHLFLPKLTPTQVRYEGGNWLDETDAAKAHGFTSIQPITALGEFLGRRRGVSGPETFWTRLSERDEVGIGRVDVAIETGRRMVNPFALQPSEDAARIATLRLQFPYYEFRDVTPHIDRLRLIKTPREIEILRYGGRVSAEAMKRAIQATAPGKYEYELEAEATYWHVKHGMQSAAYPAIVGSGPKGNQWHYQDSARQMKAGELVVMDYAGSLDQLTTDITRTWPVSGAFTEAQRKAYECVLEAQKAIIAAIKPGVTRDTVAKIAQDIYKRRGLRPGLRLRRPLRRAVGARRRRLERAVRGRHGDGDRADHRPARAAAPRPHRGHDPGDAHRRGDPDAGTAQRSRRVACPDQEQVGR